MEYTNSVYFGADVCDVTIGFDMVEHDVAFVHTFLQVLETGDYVPHALGGVVTITEEASSFVVAKY